MLKEIKNKNSIKLVRVIFKSFDSNLNISRIGLKKYLNIILTKLFTTSLSYRGPYKYDHGELLTPNRERFSIRSENPNDGPVMGVYLLTRLRGFWDPKNQELLNQKYKLVFAFEITDEQDNLLYNFIKTHKNEKYSKKNANLNYLVRKIFKKKKNWLINDYENKKRKNCKWDCVTLLMRCLKESQIIPEFRKNGENTPLLGLSAHDMAMLLLEMYQKDELLNCKYVISRELLSEKEYKKGLKMFYKKGCKIIRK